MDSIQEIWRKEKDGSFILAINWPKIPLNLING